MQLSGINSPATAPEYTAQVKTDHILDIRGKFVRLSIQVLREDLRVEGPGLLISFYRSQVAAVNPENI